MNPPTQCGAPPASECYRHRPDELLAAVADAARRRLTTAVTSGNYPTQPR